MFGAYFAYVALLSGFVQDRPNLRDQPFWLLASVIAALLLTARLETKFPSAISYFRDFLPLGLTLVAFEEMTLFAPLAYNGHLERAWIHWDRVLLDHWRLRAAIESLGPVIPAYLESCYLLVYGLGTYCIIMLYLNNRRKEVDRFFVVLLTGTLAAYALFPFFPSQPPRLLFHDLDAPTLTSFIRGFNIWILGKASHQSSVFPSAHVSSAFAAAWAMFLALPNRPRFAWGVLLYAVSVSIATIYGRYHYAADVLAGFFVSLIAAVLAWLLSRNRERAWPIAPIAGSMAAPGP
ncbi:MAG: phosphatase PAP2 family protein [Acidobacteriia bacterium]|nr:phosphatase PAP2 family protein [Terriglobia bacterium]